MLYEKLIVLKINNTILTLNVLGLEGNKVKTVKAETLSLFWPYLNRKRVSFR
jgi:hypothetical protein